ncbi:transcriptional regulator, partial [Shouchella clausii]
MVGLVQALGWDRYVEENKATSTLLTIPNMSVKEIADNVKRKLSIPFVRVIGDISMPCTRIGIL